jgi:hypothetical protein
VHSDHYDVCFPLMAYAPVTVYAAVAAVAVDSSAVPGIASSMIDAMMQPTAEAMAYAFAAAATAPELSVLALLLIGAWLLSPQGIYLVVRLTLAKSLKVLLACHR